MIFNFDCLKGLTEWTLRCRSKFYRSVSAANVTTIHTLSPQDTVKECTKATVGLFLKLTPQQTCLLDKKTPITPCALFKLSGEQHWRKDCTVYRSCTVCLTEQDDEQRYLRFSKEKIKRAPQLHHTLQCVFCHCKAQGSSPVQPLWGFSLLHLVGTSSHYPPPFFWGPLTKTDTFTFQSWDLALIHFANFKTIMHQSLLQKCFLMTTFCRKNPPQNALSPT